MSYEDDLTASVAAIGRHYQVDDLRLNHEHMATFELSGGPTITIEYAADPYPRAFIIVELGGIEENAFEEVALSLLALNGRWLDTAGASFAMHPLSDRLIAVLPVAAGALSTETLPQIVDRFLTTCSSWSDKMRRGELDFSLRDDMEAQIDAMSLSGGQRSSPTLTTPHHGG